MRAVAVLLVVLGHAGVPFLKGGYVGVDVFFVLSGFLITGLLLKEHEAEQGISIVGFYARRARRILPAGTLVLVVTVIASFVLIGGTRAARVAEDARWAALFVSNFRFIAQGTDYWSSTLPPSALQHYWSLSIEEQFYFVWPAALIVIGVPARRIALRTKLAIVLVAIIAASLAWSYYQTAINGTEAYFATLTRVWELATGALLVVSVPWLMRIGSSVGVAMSLAGVAAIGISAVLFDELTPFPGWAAVLPVGGAALAVAGGTIAPGGGAERVLRLPPFQWIGKISYSLYLWHWPLLVIGAAVLAEELSLAQNLVLTVVAMALAAVTFWLVESPTRNSAWLKARPAFVSVAAGLCLVLISLGVATGLRATLPPSITVEQQQDNPDNPPGPADAP